MPRFVPRSLKIATYFCVTQNGMEVIVYPSGQLLKGTNPQNPPKSTIGPRLEAALRNSFYRNQVRPDSRNRI